jgi:hypothetical protein
MGRAHIFKGFCIDTSTTANICCGAALDVDNFIDDSFPGAGSLTCCVRLAKPFSMKINWRNNSPFVSILLTDTLNSLILVVKQLFCGLVRIRMNKGLLNGLFYHISECTVLGQNLMHVGRR